MASELVRIRPAARVGRPIVVGVLNITPDSFSDGGQFLSHDAAISHAVQLRSQGADLIDVGGESTRPGAERIDPAVEQARILSVLTALVQRGIPVSVDTMNSSTAEAAARVGVRVVNDVSGGLADPEMYRVVARTGVRYIASHWRGHSDSMQDLAEYRDVVREVRDSLKSRIAEMLVWGVSPDRIIIDPGLGFAKTAQHNWALLAGLPELVSLGYPVLIGASRKRFLAQFAEEGAPTTARDPATAIISALAAQSGAWGVRVHDVPSTVATLAVWSAWHSGARNG
ncbi:MAG: Dihydropteroate synthase [Glaciihabitans sp.]|nr:Dihydropteroate synthase [Glaciihabitans sp.]MDQ1571541.1 dihydropteroate synthase [Actinomycetota bacterium]